MQCKEQKIRRHRCITASDESSVLQILAREMMSPESIGFCCYCSLCQVVMKLFGNMPCTHKLAEWKACHYYDARDDLEVWTGSVSHL